MGFFSAVKKFFGAKDDKLQPSPPVPENEKESECKTSGDKNDPAVPLFQNEPADPEKIFDNLAPSDDLQIGEPSLQKSGSMTSQQSDNRPDLSTNNELLVKLRGAPPKLSAWLEIILQDVKGPGNLLRERIALLLAALDAPQAEIDAFLGNFQFWLDAMEYTHIDEFRSELQYQLALALELEDEEDERSRLLLKFVDGLSKTREKLSRQLDNLFMSRGELDDDFWNELEELFITGDLGYQTSTELVNRIRERARKNRVDERQKIKSLLLQELEEIFYIPRKINAVNPPEVVLMVGVNGAGKTTTIAKLAYRAKMQGKKVLIAAGDTFRAAAIEQLEEWAKRIGVDFFAKPQGTDPAAVAFEAIEKGLQNNIDIIFIDTAGRLQTKTNLMQELKKIKQVAGKKHPGSPHRCVLVLDATTGQNALSQAKLFKEAANADELILTKLDGTARGGVAIAVAMEEHLPISYVGLGEKLEDLRPFNGNDYVQALLGETVNAA